MACDLLDTFTMSDRNKIFENIVNAVGHEVKLPIEIIRTFLTKIEKRDVAFSRDLIEVQSSLDSLERRIGDLCNFVKVPPAHFRKIGIRDFVIFHLSLAKKYYDHDFKIKLMMPEIMVNVDILKLNESFKAFFYGMSYFVNKGGVTELEIGARIRNKILMFSLSFCGEIKNEFKMELFLPDFIKEGRKVENDKFLSSFPDCYKHILAADGKIECDSAHQSAISIKLGVRTDTPEMIANYFVHESHISKLDGVAKSDKYDT